MLKKRNFIVSSQKDIVIDEKTVAFGKAGLNGEVRAVNMAEQRVLECPKLGFDMIILPRVCMKTVSSVEGIRLISVETICDAIRYVEEQERKSRVCNGCVTKIEKICKKRVDADSGTCYYMEVPSGASVLRRTAKKIYR